MSNATDITTEEIDDAMALGTTGAEIAAKTKEEIANEEEKRRWSRLLAQDDFIWFLNTVIQRTGLLTPTERSSGESNIRAGEKNIGIFIQDRILSFCPERLHQILNYSRK